MFFSKPKRAEFYNVLWNIIQSKEILYVIIHYQTLWQGNFLINYYSWLRIHLPMFYKNYFLNQIYQGFISCGKLNNWKQISLLLDIIYYPSLRHSSLRGLCICLSVTKTTSPTMSQLPKLFMSTSQWLSN